MLKCTLMGHMVKSELAKMSYLISLSTSRPCVSPCRRKMPSGTARPSPILLMQLTLNTVSASPTRTCYPAPTEVNPLLPLFFPTSILKPPVAPDTPRTYPPSSDPPLEQPKKIISEIQRINRDETTQHDRFKAAHRSTTRYRKDPNALQAFDEDNIAQYWFNYLTPNYEYYLSSIETQHFTLTVTAKDDTVPKSFWQ
jgi:hypothetical protein